MGFDASKVSDVVKQTDEIDPRADLLESVIEGRSALDAVSAAADLTSVHEMSAKIDEVRNIAAGSFGAGLLSSPGLSDMTTSLDTMRERMTKPLGTGVAGLASGFTENMMHDVAKRLAKPTIPVDAVSVLKDMQRRPAIDATKFLAYGNLNRQVIETANALSGLGRMRALEDFRPITGFKPREIPSVLSYAAGLNKSLAAFDAAMNNSAAELGKKISAGFYPNWIQSWIETFRPMEQWWAQFAEDIRRFAEWAASQPAPSDDDPLGVAAYDALEAIEDGRYWVADRFLRRHLNIKPKPHWLPYIREAMWKVLQADFNKPVGNTPKWLILKGRQATAYLSTAIWNEARRLRRDREMADRLWKELGGETPVYIGEQSELLLPTLEDPAETVVQQLDGQPPDERILILDELSLNGTQRDLEIIGLIRDGSYTRAGIRNIAGSPNLQSFERKIRRQRKNGKIWSGDS